MTSAIPVPLTSRPRTGPTPIFARHLAGAHLASRQQALIVDDCRFIAERVARALEAKGFECTVVANGFAGLELVRVRRFDLLVLDVDMPFVDGFTVLRQVRRSSVHADTPVLMLAARHSEADRERATLLGANGYMAKPLQLRPLNAMVESMMI